jgi:lipoprotein-anchoring transpeptidase ErfK/SrfK
MSVVNAKRPRSRYSFALCLAALTIATAVLAQEPATVPPTTTPAEETSQLSSDTPTSTPATPIAGQESARPPVAQAGGSAPTGEPLRVIIKRLKLPLPFTNARIIIRKSERMLYLYSGQSIVKAYHVALGSNPVGSKQQQGDGRTPEGRFYICKRNSTNSAFHVFLGLNYPALPDANRGITNKLIDAHEYKVIRRQLASRGTPPWHTRLGGWVGIHGGTDGAFAQRIAQQRGSADWTQGCIGVTNAEIEEIGAATQLGTPVTIVP